MPAGSLQNVGAAWRMVKSESRAETLLAVFILLATFGPFLYQVWLQQRGGER